MKYRVERIIADENLAVARLILNASHPVLSGGPSLKPDRRWP